MVCEIMEQDWDTLSDYSDFEVSVEAKEAIFDVLKSFTDAVCHEIK